MAKTLSRTSSILLILTALFAWSFFGGVGCSGGGGVEQDQGPYQGPVRLVSIYPAGGPPGTTVSVCTQGIADEAIFSFCDQPVPIPEAAALRLTVEDDPSYTGCDEGTHEVLLTVPENCPTGEVSIKAAAGTEESNTISFTVTVATVADESGGDDESTPGGTTPGGNTPAGNTPGGNTPSGNTPGGNTPAGTTTEGGRTPLTDVAPVDTDINCPDEKTCEYPTAVCDTTTGDCVECLPDNTSFCGTAEYDFATGPGFRCDTTTKSCFEVQCTTTAHCTNERALSFDVTCGEHGCSCNESTQLCVPNAPPPEQAVIEVIAEEQEIVGSSLDQMEYAAIKLTTHQARSAYIYGDFFFQTSYIVSPCPANVNPPPMGCGERPPTDPAGAVWTEMERWGVAQEVRIQPWVFQPALRVPAPTNTWEPLFQNVAWAEHDIEECWPEASVGDPHYCHGLSDYLEAHIPERTAPEYNIDTTRADYSDHQSQRVFRYRVQNVGGESAEEKIIFKMFKPQHRFWAVVETDAGNGEYPIQIIVPEEEELDLPHPEIDSCKVTPVRYAPFLRVDVNITGASTARVEAEFPGIQRLGGTGWTGGDGRSWRPLVIQRNLPLTSHDFSGSVYIPVKDHRLDVRCFASGVTVGGSGGGAIMKANKVVIGSETSERVDLDESDAFLNSSELSAEEAPKLFKATPREGQGSEVIEDNTGQDCAVGTDDILLRSFILGTWSNSLRSYQNAHLSADDRVGQCNPKVSWDFSQPMTVTEIAPPYPYNTSTTVDGLEDGEYRFPFAGEIKVAAYPNWDSLSREWSEINDGYSYTEGTPTDTEATCLYRFVANDYTGGGILINDGHALTEAPPADAYMGRTTCRDSSLHQATDEDPATLKVEDLAGETGSYLSGAVEKERTYSTDNIYRIWIRQQTNAIGTGAIPRRETLDLQYVSEFKLAPSSTIEGQWDHEVHTVDGTSDFGGLDGLINEPIYEPWVIKIPFKFQHIDLTTLETKLLCWGQHPDTDGDGLDDYSDYSNSGGVGISYGNTGPDDDADGDGLEDAEYPWWDEHDQSITHRSGWLEGIPAGETRVYFAHIGSNYVYGDCPSGPFGLPGACGVDEYGEYIHEAWGPYHFSTSDFPPVATYNQDSEDGEPVAVADQVQKRRGNFTNVVLAVEGPYFQFTTRFRQCIFRVKATGYDGSQFEKNVSIPSEANWDKLTKVGEVMEGAMAEEPDYFTNFDYDGETHSLNPYYTTSHTFGSCTIDQDCPFNCEELNDARPCNECRPNSNRQYKCYSRKFEPNGTTEQLRAAFGRL